MKRLLLATACSLAFLASQAQQKFEAPKESIKTRNVNQLFANFPEATDDALWKVKNIQFTLKNLPQFTKDSVLVFTYKVVMKQPNDKIKSNEVNVAPKEGKNLEIYLTSSSLGDDYEKAIRGNVKPQYERTKDKVLVPKTPVALKAMIDKIVIW